MTEHIRQSRTSLHRVRAPETLDQALSCLERGEISAIDVMRALLAEVPTRKESRLVKKISIYPHPSLLIVDEIGYLSIASGGASFPGLMRPTPGPRPPSIFELVNTRYEKDAFGPPSGPVWMAPASQEGVVGFRRPVGCGHVSSVCVLHGVCAP